MSFISEKQGLLTAIALGIALLGARAPALAAADDLVVEFASTPLFSEVNMLPGNELGRWIKVTNNTAGTKDIILEAINESDPGGLGAAIDIGIWENGMQRYATTTLEDFFDAGGILLSPLAGGGTMTQYDVVLAFHAGAGNAYQGTNVGFDILIGFQGEGGVDDGNGGNGGGGGGGGGGGAPQGLSIFDEGTAIPEVGETSVTIVWTTSYRSTSRVIYGTTTGMFDYSSPPNYGYPFSTVEADTPATPNGVLNHSVTITGLTPGTTYYYRTISHASPDTISREQQFTTLRPGERSTVIGEGGEVTAGIAPGGGPPAGGAGTDGGIGAPGAPEGGEGGGGASSDSTAGVEIPPAGTESAAAAGADGSALAAAGAALTLGTGRTWVGILVALLALGLIALITYAVIRRRKGEHSV